MANHLNALHDYDSVSTAGAVNYDFVTIDAPGFPRSVYGTRTGSRRRESTTRANLKPRQKGQNENDDKAAKDRWFGNSAGGFSPGYMMTRGLLNVDHFLRDLPKMSEAHEAPDCGEAHS